MKRIPIPCKISCDDCDDGAVHSAFYYADMPTWNGWLIPYVDLPTLYRVFGDFYIMNAPYAEGIDKEEADEFCRNFQEAKPDENGLYECGWGLCWSIIEEEQEESDQ